jgi:hypothetical protein
MALHCSSTAVVPNGRDEKKRPDGPFSFYIVSEARLVIRLPSQQINGWRCTW